MKVLVTRRLVCIDDAVTVEDLLDSWVKGRKADVLEALNNDHVGLTALFITEGIRQGAFEDGDLNVITNTLIDDRVYLLHHPE